MNKAYFHLPGLFEFVELYRKFLPLFFNHPEYFYDYCQIGSIYGSPAECLWGGGRVGYGDGDTIDVLALMKKYNISARLTFSNSLLTTSHLQDRKCNELCKIFEDDNNGIIIYSDLLLEHIKHNYPKYYFVSSTTKVITDFDELIKELDEDEFKYVVPDFRFNKSLYKLQTLTQKQKDKIELLCNECCDIKCNQRKACYENVSRKNLNEDCLDHVCPYNETYSFSNAMKNPSFISVNDIQNTYLPLGINNFKIEGRSLGSALVLEFLLYYLTKPEYQINVREEIYLDNNLDLF